MRWTTITIPSPSGNSQDLSTVARNPAQLVPTTTSPLLKTMVWIFALNHLKGYVGSASVMLHSHEGRLALVFYRNGHVSIHRRVMCWRSFFCNRTKSLAQTTTRVGRQAETPAAETARTCDQVWPACFSMMSFGREFASFIEMGVAVSCTVMWAWKFGSRTTSIFLKPCGWIGLICWMWWLLSCRWSSTYEELLGTSRPFTQPVPLPVCATLIAWEAFCLTWGSELAALEGCPRFSCSCLAKGLWLDCRHFAEWYSFCL
jgi:hypothetical protein